MERKIVYKELVGMMAKEGIDKKSIYETLGITSKGLYNKLHGVTDFTWTEVVTIHQKYFPMIAVEQMMKRG